jgi:predicted nucleotidyltransferase
MNIIEQKQDSIFRLCKLHKVKHLYAFGSALTGQFNDESDVDLIVDFQDIPVEEYADNYFNLKFSLQEVFNRPVDLLENKAIKNPYFLHGINRQKQIVYG